MNLTIINTGVHAVRVIIDHDTVNDSQLDAGEETTVDAPGGVVELRELEMNGEGDDAEEHTSGR
ncbi:hypothetical protein [Paraburkholderia sp. HD33-4]|uniref:hypothetical protein n=1 Tax=Paraburkholderia sp. HD33-4 TaxID=2883242 RepID=UPI001F2E983A|nr:hypothetical protein [Paraburkholderia sp. HD33-4]